MRVLILSHGHPRFSKGGGELAAYALYRGISAKPEHQAWFIARAPAQWLPEADEIMAIAPGEYLMRGEAECMGLHASVHLDEASDVAALLREIAPDVVHFHHYFYLGIELIRVVRRFCPNAKVVLTLHEFIALCVNDGQMVKTDGRLCYRANPLDCHGCFPERPVSEFFLRERYLKSFFAVVDHFIAPSHFLAQRYLDWGLPGERLHVQENLIEERPRLPPRPLTNGRTRGRFAYFGQLTPYKGLDLLLDAFSRLPKSLKGLSLEIYGGGLERYDESFQRRIHERLAANAKRARWHGPYELEELPDLMMGIDWVLMGSLWWENSPLVIQEAFRLGRPVICPNLGGMAEKVTSERSGLHFRARDPVDLAQTLRRAATEPGLWERLAASLPQPPMPESVLESHLTLYST